jgi:hypothetical protein
VIQRDIRLVTDESIAAARRKLVIIGAGGFGAIVASVARDINANMANDLPAPSNMATESESTQNVYWTWPFENYKTFCPYLVGSYQNVYHKLSGYLQVGYRTFILDIPPSREELQHTQAVFQMASERTMP